MRFAGESGLPIRSPTIGRIAFGSTRRWNSTRRRDANPKGTEGSNAVSSSAGSEFQPEADIFLHHQPREGTEHNRAHSLLEARYSQERGIELAGLPVTTICIERVTNWGTFPWSPRRFAAKVSHTTRTGGKDGFWRGDVLHRLFDDPGGARPAAGRARLP